MCYIDMCGGILMKIRTGFVSNSSSSSFIVAVPKTISDVDDLQKYLIGEQIAYPNPYIWNKESIYAWPARLIASIVFEDMQNAGKASLNDAIETYSSGYTKEWERAEEDALVKFRLGKWDRKPQEFYEYQEVVCKQYSEEKVKEFFKDNPDCDFYTLSYADDTELGSAMEHGELFNHIPCLKASNH